MCIRDRTMGASLFGFIAWAFPVALLSGLGMGSSWTIVELALSVILVYHGASMLTRGRIAEVEALSRALHARLDQKYRDWRGARRFSEDVYLGLWLAWLIWLVEPSMIAQGVGATARSGLLGTLISPLMLASYGVAAGIAATVLRSVPLIFGQYSSIIGLMSVGLRPRAWGLAVSIMGAVSYTHLTLPTICSV